MTSRILIITSNAPDAKILEDTLAKTRDGPFITECLSTLDASMARLESGGIDMILVDLTLPDSQGIPTFEKLFAAVPRIPIMILSADVEEEDAIKSVELGAQGYLSKGYFGSSLTPQALRNVIQRKSVEERNDKEQVRAEIALNSISDAVICTDVKGNIDYLNDAAETLTGWSKSEAFGQPVNSVFRLINGKTRKPIRDTAEKVLEHNKITDLPLDTILICKDGSEAPIEDSASPIHDWGGNLTGTVIVFHDVSDAQAMTIKMAHLAQHDFLTNLPNRILLNDRISQAITMAKRNNTQLAILFLDLDNFKNINDSLGHAAGDLLLQSVAQRLSDCVRGSDTVSRQGGDEFVILLGGGKQDDDVGMIASKILHTLSQPYTDNLIDLYITTSIGISLFPVDGTNAETLIKNADTAMYYAKERGKNNFQFFRNDMNIRAVERQYIETNLRLALDKQEFSLHYQPKFNLITKRISGAEALLRWMHPEWGMVMPKRYMRIAEECGLIVPIGRWVLREACMQTKKWIDLGLPPFSMAVNISALEFRQPDFLEGVRSILDETGLRPEYLQLEITESVLMSDASTSKTILQDLKEMGVQLAVDDFGTGYSSLSYLNQFPLDVIKIDQSFVEGIGKSTDSGIIVGAVIGMGNNLKLRVIAEGIETETQLKFLRGLDCLEGQGFLFSRPIATEQFAALLASDNELALAQ
jgi:diguanylate cyclase (GGDEF)-like protein/PAS domain S-box-containing protein